MSSIIATRIDLREINPRERHTLIFARFDALDAGESLELLNDHDPVPLRYQLEDRSAGCYEWSALEAGPDLWRVRIAKTHAVAAPVGSDSCCSGGACGG